MSAMKQYEARIRERMEDFRYELEGLPDFNGIQRLTLLAIFQRHIMAATYEGAQLVRQQMEVAP